MKRVALAFVWAVILMAVLMLFGMLIPGGGEGRQTSATWGAR